MNNTSEHGTYHLYNTDLDPNDTSEWPSYPGEAYLRRDNRLLYYELFDGDPNDPETNLVRTVSYAYYKTGDACNITVKDEYLDPQTTPGDPNDYDWPQDLALYYDMGHQLRIGLWGRWKDEDGNGLADPGTYEHSAAREFRYDPLFGPRARYRTIDFHTDASTNPSQWTQVGAAHWTDYDSVLPYSDRGGRGRRPGRVGVHRGDALPRHR